MAISRTLGLSAASAWLANSPTAQSTTASVLIARIILHESLYINHCPARRGEKTTPGPRKTANPLGHSAERPMSRLTPSHDPYFATSPHYDPEPRAQEP